MGIGYQQQNGRHNVRRDVEIQVTNDSSKNVPLNKILLELQDAALIVVDSLRVKQEAAKGDSRVIKFRNRAHHEIIEITKDLVIPRR